MDYLIYHFGISSVGTNRNLVFDGYNRCQTLSQLKTYFRAHAFGLREQYSISENVNFLSTTYSSSNFLRVDSTIASGVESGGRINNAFVTSDFARDAVRTGYPLGGQTNGGGALPDIGAYEFDGFPNTSNAYSATTVTHPTFLASARNKQYQQILKTEVITTGSYNLKSITNLQFDAFNTDNISDVDSAMLYYTSSMNAFDTFMYLGRVKPTILGYNIPTNVKLQTGSNYFWLVYQTNDTVTLGDSIDAELVDIVVGGATQTINAAPDRGREIKGPMCGTFTVGASGNYTTITDVAAELWNREVDTTCTTGVVFKLLDATYSTNETFPIVFDSIVGTGAGGRSITIKPDVGVTSTITGSNAHSLIQFRGTRYFTLDGNNGNGAKSIIIKNNNDGSAGFSGDAVTNGFSYTDIAIISYGTNLGTKYLTINACQITTNTGAPLTAVNAVTGGITTASTVIPTQVFSSDNDNLTIDSCWFYNVAAPLWVFGASQSTGAMDSLMITNNIIGHDDYVTNRGAYGILTYYTNVSYYNSNKIYNLISNSTVSWVNPFAIQVQLTSANGLVEIKKNTIYSIRYERVSATGFGTAGIYVSPSAANSNVKIHNNTISDMIGTGNTIAAAVGSGIKGISIGGTTTSNVEIYNNSVNLTGTVVRSGATNDKSACIFIDNVADSIYTYNNTTYNSIQNSSGIDTAFGVYCLAASSKLKRIDNNNYFTNATRSRLAFFLSAGSVNTLANIKAATGQDTFSVSGDPKYNTNTNLRPQSTSNLYLAGKTLASITDDLLGIARGVIPTIGAFEDTGDFAAPVITYAAFGNSSNVATYNINSNVKATDPLPGTPATTCRVYYRKSTNANAWGGTNDNTTDGWKYVDGTVSGIYFNIPIDHTLLFGGTNPADVIYYFIIAQDGKAIPNVSYTKGTLTNTPTSITLTTEFPLTGSPDSYIINNAISGWIDVGPSYTFKNLTGDTGVFKYMNQNVLGGDLHVRIRQDLTEPGTNVLNEISDSIGTSRLIIYPDNGSVVRKITGYVAQAMIRISGADRVSIDGRDTATQTGKYLLFRNTHATNPTIQFLNDPSYDTIEYCTIEGMNSSSTSGVVYMGQGLTNGVDNITIDHNDLRNRSDSSAAALPNTLIYNEGLSISILNDNNNFTNNNIFNFNNVGIFAANIGNGSGVNITGNSFYFNHTINSTISQFGINWSAGGLSGGNTISNNYFGGSTANCGGSYWTNSSTTSGTAFNAIRITGNNVNSNILGNTIKNISIPNAGNGPQFIGIVVNGSGEETVGSLASPNIIGDATDTTSINLSTSSNTHYGIFGSSTNNLRIRYNKIQGMKLNSSTAGATMILSTGATGFDSVEYNEIGSSAVNSINHYGISSFTGIQATKTLGSLVNSNIIKNISVFGTAIQVIGISHQATASNIYLTNNTIGSSTATNGIRMYGTGAGNFWGINTSVTATASCYISGNVVKGIQALSTSNTGQMAGAQFSSTGKYWVYNNTIGETGTTNSWSLGGTHNFFGIMMSNTDTSICYNNRVTSINLSNSGAASAFVGNYHSAVTPYLLDSGNYVGETSLSGSITMAGTGNFFGIENLGACTNGIFVRYNTIGGLTRSSTGTYTSYGVFNNDASNINTAHHINNNTIQNLTFAGAATTYGINSTTNTAVANNGGPGNRNYNNTIKTISFTHASSASTFYPLYNAGAGDWLVYNNIIGDTSATSDISMKEVSANGFGAIYNFAGTDTVIVYGNIVGGITINNSSTSPNMYGFVYVPTTSYPNYLVDSANTIGNANVSGSITINGNGAFYGHYFPSNISPTGTRGINIRNNRIGGITRASTGATNTYGIFDAWVPTGLQSPHNINDNTISNWNMANVGITTAILCNVSSSRNNFVYNNTIKGFTFTNSGTSGSFSGIAIIAGKVLLTQPDSASAGNNVIGDPAVSNSINSSMNGPHNGISTSSANAIQIIGNSINNITATSTGTSCVVGGIACGNGATATTITNNTIKNLSCAGTGTNTFNLGGAVCGIYTTSTSTMTVNNNIVNGISLTSTGTTSNACGIDLYLSGNTTVNSNRIYNMSSTSNGNLTGMYFNSTNASTHVLKNNQISIANGANTNDLPIQGIYADNAAGSGTVQMYYNTVHLSGSISSGSNISTSYLRNSTTGATNVLNNIFMNTRTGGSGNHVAQYYSAGISNNNTNYNLNITGDSNTAVRNSSTNYDINAWRYGLKRDSSGWYAIAGTNVVADSMFIDKANGDLGINTTTTDAWYANGKGVQTPGYADEYGNPASVRSTTVSGGAPDLGSDEFTPTSDPDQLFCKGPHTNGNTDSLMYGFRPVAYLKWRGTSIPTFTMLRYYTGTAPPDNTNNGSNPTARYLNCYWWISATGGTAEYNINFIYDDALVGTLSSESALRISRKEVGVAGSWKAHIADATVNTTTNNMQLLNTHGFSIWTGSDNASPLPVTLVTFNGEKHDKNVILKWVTSFEEQMDGFEVEYSIDAQNFTSIGFTKASNNHFSENNYNLLHTSPVKGNNYYRLKTIESNGKYSYSNILVVNFDDVDRMQVLIQPNPSKDQVNVVLQNQTQPALIQVFDMTGRLMFNEKVTLGQNVTQVNLNGWNLGSYIIRVTNDDGTSFINRIMKVEE